MSQTNSEQDTAGTKESGTEGASNNKHEEEIDDITSLVERLSTSCFKLSIKIPNEFYGGIIGRRGATKQEIEKVTQTKIKIPRSYREDVIINGTTIERVCQAHNQIMSLLPALRTRMRPTHFLSIPLHFGEIKMNYNAFKEQILAANLPGIDEDNFQSEHRLHLTLGVCVLLNYEEENKAVKLLQNCGKFLEDLQTPFTVKVCGLETWSENLRAVRVIYGTVVASELQKFADRVYNYFLKHNLAINDYQRDYVNLHMTVMQNSYRTRNPPQKQFDASEIFERFNKFDFGTAAQCNELKLCVMRTGVSSNEPYEQIGSLKF